MKSTQLIAIAFVVTFPFSHGRPDVPVKIEFRRDVQPLLKAHCVECHGPQEQKNGFRLDRRTDSVRPAASGAPT